MEFLYEGLNAGASIKAVADLIGICSRTLRRWGLDISGQGFSVDRRKGAPRRADSKFQHGFRSGWRIAISSNAVMSCITACMPALID